MEILSDMNLNGIIENQNFPKSSLILTRLMDL
jgi:hypothetical protein